MNYFFFVSKFIVINFVNIFFIFNNIKLNIIKIVVIFLNICKKLSVVVKLVIFFDNKFVKKFVRY